MMPYGKNRQIGLAFAAILGIALLESPGHAQDAAWEGLITAGRSALQQQNFAEAERHFESALEAAERFSSDDPRLGKSFNNLAAVYYAQEDYARAEPLMRRALAQLRQALGPENTEVAQTMKNLAALYFLQGNRSEAEALLKQALAILESVHGPNHAFVATVLSNLAGLYQAEDRYQDAEPLLTRSLAIWEGLLGVDHPDVVRSRALLAQVREAQGGGGTGQATAAVNPRALTPAIADETGRPTTSDADAEIERATAALEDLTEASRAEADRARAGGVPVPALNPIGEVGQAGIDAALAPESGEAETGQPTVAEAGGEGRDPNEIVTSSIEEVANSADRAATATATAILNEATSADDVSYAVYLSTLWSIDEARRYWQAMQVAVPNILRGKRMEIEAVAAGDGADPFYRVLTTPFTSDPEAQAACERIKSKLRTHDCNVVVRGATAGG
ncbi:MAG: tetratricopeptide repeat protein [Geminicoccaceae bacterium]